MAKTLTDNYTNQINVNKTHIAETDKEIERLSKNLLELQKGNVYYDKKGQLISSSDPSIGEAQMQELQSQIDALKQSRQNSLAEIDALDLDRTNIVNEFTGTPQVTPQSKVFNESVGYKFVKGANPDDIKTYTQQMKAAKTREDRLKIQKRAFEYGLVEPK
jgi:regulator of replication initiation timing